MHSTFLSVFLSSVLVFLPTFFPSIIFYFSFSFSFSFFLPFSALLSDRLLFHFIVSKEERTILRRGVLEKLSYMMTTCDDVIIRYASFVFYFFSFNSSYKLSFSRELRYTVLHAQSRGCKNDDGKGKDVTLLISSHIFSYFIYFIVF